jgi:hypothetical protein
MTAKHGGDYWADLALVRALSSHDQFILFDDLRFPNEADGLRNLSEPLVLIRLDISEETRDARYLAKYGEPLDPKVANHVSEHALDDYPHFTARIDAERPFREVFADVLHVLRRAGIPLNGFDSPLNLLLERAA